MIISRTNRAFEVKWKTFFLVSQVLSFMYTKQTSKNVADTTLKLFGNMWGNLYAEFTILDIKYCFTSGKLNFHKKTLKCKDIMLLIVQFIETYYCRTEVFKYILFSYTIFEWNKLDSDFKDAVPNLIQCTKNPYWSLPDQGQICYTKFMIL